MTVNRDDVAGVLGIICIIFGAIECLSLLWYFGSNEPMALLLKATLVISETYVGIQAMRSSWEKDAQVSVYVGCLVGILISLYLIYSHTIYETWVDWPAIWLRSIVLISLVAVPILKNGKK